MLPINAFQTCRDKKRKNTDQKHNQGSLATVHIPEIKGKMSYTNGCTQQLHRVVVTHMLKSALQHVYFKYNVYVIIFTSLSTNNVKLQESSVIRFHHLGSMNVGSKFCTNLSQRCEEISQHDSEP